MDYQVWTKAEFGDQWDRQDCGDIDAAKRTLLEASKAGKEAMLTVEVPFELELKVGEPGAEPKTPRKTAKQLADEKAEEERKREANPDPPE